MFTVVDHKQIHSPTGYSVLYWVYEGVSKSFRTESIKRNKQQEQ